MAKGASTTPVIIKRPKVVIEGGHHGGAWKVAYADFVTAMMAFFLLMWLLNATTEKQRKGLADYFNPTIPINRISGGGDGALNGDSIFAQQRMAQTGTGAIVMSSSKKSSDTDDSPSKDTQFAPVTQAIDRTLNGFGGESMASTQMARHIVTRVTDEGLIVEFFDLENEPLFDPETDAPMPVLRDIAAMLTRVFGLVENDIAVNGYVRSYPHVLREDPVWPLSATHAQKTRQLLEDTGFDKPRIQRVTGFADRKPAIRASMAPRNNRIEVILLRRTP